MSHNSPRVIQVLKVSQNDSGNVRRHIRQKNTRKDFRLAVINKKTIFSNKVLSEFPNTKLKSDQERADRQHILNNTRAKDGWNDQ